MNPAPPEDRVAECTPTYTLDRQIAEAKAEIGPKRWAELESEWDVGEG